MLIKDLTLCVDSSCTGCLKLFSHNLIFGRLWVGPKQLVLIHHFLRQHFRRVGSTLIDQIPLELYILEPKAESRTVDAAPRPTTLHAWFHHGLFEKREVCVFLNVHPKLDVEIEGQIRESLVKFCFQFVLVAP